ncbi:MAG: hypothetical protein COA73_03065 [Candidatus Hydrogenedentota bacterium]|nr:MAG: hypothetical protein COA73_03065 [Candidatus Hydrogenedentota bacterium]
MTFFRSALGRALIAFFLVLLLGAIFNADGAFFKLGTHRDTLRQASVYGILACGMTIVILAGGIDLAVGSVMALVAVVFSILTIHWGWSGFSAIPASLLVGMLAGSVSGVLSARFRIQPFIATLAMMVFARGLAKVSSGGMKVSTAIQDTDGTYKYVEVPGIFRAIDTRILWDSVSVVTLIFLACFGMCYFLLSKHILGRYIYAIGGNEDAARYSGVPVVGIKVLTYALSGFFAAVAGICQAAQEQQGDPDTGAGYELTAIAIVVVGGTSLMGGRGGIGLTFAGMLIIGYLEKILSINAVAEANRLMLTGLIIIGAVLLQRQNSRTQEN